MTAKHQLHRAPGLILVALFACLSPLSAEDWPQHLGPRRNGTSTETGLNLSWPKSGPPVLWHKDVGEGYSSPVVAGERLILFHRQEGKEIVACLNAQSGREIWKRDYAAPYQDALGKGDGPRSTPVIAGDRVYTLGVAGWLQCLKLKDGSRIWGRSINKDYDVPPSYFGVGTSPLVVGKRVLINVGGKNAGIVAFNADTGAEEWKATTDAASYSSPIGPTIGGKQLAVFFTRQGVVHLNPASGEVLYQKKWRARYAASVNAATPLAIGNLLFFSASYETGALLLCLDGDKVNEVWTSEDAMSNHYNTCVAHDGYLYGCDGRQESGARLRCVSLKDAKVMWTKEGFGCATLLLVEGKILALTEAGDLVTLAANPKEYHELARGQVLKDTPCRAEMALANGRLYSRDGSRLVCWDLRKR
jgi:outer membrane protein assembly factor BamB